MDAVEHCTSLTSPAAFLSVEGSYVTKLVSVADIIRLVSR